MKKLLFAALLSLAGVGLSTGQASAWLFHHHCCKNCASICVKPYNAFSPSVFGSICADGCFPISASHGPAAPPWAGGPACCGPVDGGCGTAPATTSPPAKGTPTMLPGGSGGAAFQVPTPSMIPAGAQVGMPGVQPTGYGPLPWMQPPPAYWANPNGQ
jgi:hypothetical protein